MCAQKTARAPRVRARRPPSFSPLARPDIRPVYASAGPRPEIDFTIGVPDVRELRFDVWNRLASRAMRQYCRQGSAYGYPQGSSLLRRVISDHVSFSRAVAASEDTVVVTSGAQHAIALLARIPQCPVHVRHAIAPVPARHGDDEAAARCVARFRRARHQRVFYVGTFSKSLFPGLRVGFIVAPPWAVDALVAA